MSKLAWHFQGMHGWGPGVVNSEYVKIMNPPIGDMFPERKTIGRVYIADAITNDLIWRGESGAVTWWNMVAPNMTTPRYVHIWELPNEPQPLSDYQFCKNLAAFTKKAASLMHAEGLKVLGGNISEGNPGGDTDQERSNLFCAIAEGLVYCDGWSQHAYWVPEGYPHPEAGYNQWHALRYQMNRQYARERGIKLPPVYLTEGGWDFTFVGKPKCGWRSYAPWERYFADLKRFDNDLMADPDVKCCTLFVSDPNEDWTDYGIQFEESRLLAQYITATPTPPVLEPVLPPDIIDNMPSLARPLPANRGTVVQKFGENYAKYAPYGFAGHEGLDYSCPVGTTVFASEKGTVKWAGFGSGVNANYGLYVVINHGEFETWYCHLSAVLVKAGDVVVQKQVIGKTGNTGKSTGPHLHYAVRVPTAKNASKGFVDPWAIRVILGDG